MVQEILLFSRMFILFCLLHVALFAVRQGFNWMSFFVLTNLLFLVALYECLLFSFFLQTQHDRIQSKIPDDLLVLSVSWLLSSKDKSRSVSIRISSLLTVPFHLCFLET